MACSRSRVHRTAIRLIGSAILFLGPLVRPSDAVELRGQVTAVQANRITIELETEERYPRQGDVVQLYTVVPGFGESARQATWQVVSVSRISIVAEVTAPTEVQAAVGDVAKIDSPSPQSPSEIPAAPRADLEELLRRAEELLASDKDGENFYKAGDLFVEACDGGLQEACPHQENFERWKRRSLDKLPPLEDFLQFAGLTWRMKDPEVRQLLGEPDSGYEFSEDLRYSGPGFKIHIRFYKDHVAGIQVEGIAATRWFEEKGIRDPRLEILGSSYWTVFTRYARSGIQFGIKPPEEQPWTWYERVGRGSVLTHLRVDCPESFEICTRVQVVWAKH